MTIHKSNRVQITGEKRREIAKEAFWGSNEPVAEHIKTVLSYEMDDRIYPANGFDQTQAIKIVGEMDAIELLKFIKPADLAIVQDETELISGDEISIKVIFNNLTGRNFSGQEYENYLTWVKKQLSFPALAPEKLFIIIK